MRRSLWALAGVLMLAGCQLSLPGGAKSSADPNPISGAEIEVTSLDAPDTETEPQPAAGDETKAQVAAQAEAKPAPKPGASPSAPTPAPAEDSRAEGGPTTEGAPGEAVGAAVGEAAAQPEAEAPLVEKSPARLACEKRKGIWTQTASGKAAFCQIPTRDGGKFCRKSTDCEGYCLARSQTCAPVTPLFGCQEILNEDGRVLTQCIN